MQNSVYKSLLCRSIMKVTADSASLESFVQLLAQCKISSKVSALCKLYAKLNASCEEIVKMQKFIKPQIISRTHIQYRIYIFTFTFLLTTHYSIMSLYIYPIIQPAEEDRKLTHTSEQQYKLIRSIAHMRDLGPYIFSYSSLSLVDLYCMPKNQFSHNSTMHNT